MTINTNATEDSVTYKKTSYLSKDLLGCRHKSYINLI